jgi:tRNA pseudouridine55 synthase
VNGGGLVVVDKPAGLTSHTVVARIRRLAGTKRVGHAGTLDPAATGVLLVGVERATRLLGYLAATDKSYTATIRLGQSTATDDAESEVTGGSSAAGLVEDDVRAGVGALTGPISQVPSSVSAIKVDGRRAYARVRAGEDVQLKARDVVVSRFDVLALTRPDPDLLDVQVAVSCSTGTYIRALARDLGAGLGVGGHLTALRRVRVGVFDEAEALTLEQLGDTFEVLSLAEVVTRCFPTVVLDDEAAAAVRHGRRVVASAQALASTGPVGVFDEAGRVLALMETDGVLLKPLVVFEPASAL